MIHAHESHFSHERCRFQRLPLRLRRSQSSKQASSSSGTVVFDLFGPCARTIGGTDTPNGFFNSFVSGVLTDALAAQVKAPTDGLFSVTTAFLSGLAFSIAVALMSNMPLLSGNSTHEDAT